MPARLTTRRYAKRSESARHHEEWDGIPDEVGRIMQVFQDRGRKAAETKRKRKIVTLPKLKCLE
jgi:hypothetical protein